MGVVRSGVTALCGRVARGGLPQSPPLVVEVNVLCAGPFALLPEAVDMTAPLPGEARADALRPNGVGAETERCNDRGGAAAVAAVFGAGVVRFVAPAVAAAAVFFVNFTLPFDIPPGDVAAVTVELARVVVVLVVVVPFTVVRPVRLTVRPKARVRGGVVDVCS